MSHSVKVVLASASPRRRELLGRLDIAFGAAAVAVDETRRPGEPAGAYVRRMALAKARAAHASEGDCLPALGADTVIVTGDKVLGKPRDEADGLAMLAALSGGEHQVLTGVAVSARSGERWRLSVSRVRWRDTTAAERAAYWASGEGIDKAGAYAVQGKAGMFVEHLAGSCSGVMGLPLLETAELLGELGIDVLACPEVLPSSGANG